MVHLLSLALIPAALGCPFCGPSKRLVDRVAEAQVVLAGRLHSATLPTGQAGGVGGGGGPTGSTRLKVAKVVKGHPLADGKADVTLAAYLPVRDGDETDAVVFADVRDGQLAPFYVAQDTEGTFAYLTAALALERSGPAERLGYFFGHLDNANDDLARDAYSEFGVTPFAEVKAAAKRYDADRIARWLEDRRHPGYQRGLLGILLGLSGEVGTAARPSRHAAVLRRVLDKSAELDSLGLDGVIAGLCMLEPKRGPAHLATLLGNAKVHCNVRYAGLKAAAFLLTEVPAADRGALLAAVRKELGMADTADLAVNVLADGAVWDLTADICRRFPAAGPAPRGSSAPMLRRAIAKYLAVCPNADAKAALEEIRARDPQLVADTLEDLRLEAAQKRRQEAERRPAQ